MGSAEASFCPNIYIQIPYMAVIRVCFDLRYKGEWRKPEMPGKRTHQKVSKFKNREQLINIDEDGVESREVLAHVQDTHET